MLTTLAPAALATPAQLRIIAGQLPAPLSDIARDLAERVDDTGVLVEYRAETCGGPPDELVSVDYAADALLVMALASELLGV